MNGGNVVVIGDALLDRDLDGRVERLAPDAPVPVVEAPESRDRPGGAALAAALAAADGVSVTLATALGDDDAGARLRALLAEARVGLVDLGRDGATPQKIRIRAGGRSLLRVDHDGPTGSIGAPPAVFDDLLAGAAAILVADYGRGVAAQPRVRRAVAAAARRHPVVWDPHPLGPRCVPGTTLLTPNEQELALLTPDPRRSGLAALTARARLLARRWRARAVAMTLAERGALLVLDEATPLLVPAPPTAGGDPCGAGDRFAAAAAVSLGRRSVLSEVVEASVRSASAFVAAGGASAFRVPAERSAARGSASLPDPARLIAEVRSRGGTVVATGGCFDLLHAGHVATLQAARRLGDCLVVLLNDDDSVRRLKGDDRPVQPAGDRAAVLRAIGCVDAVEVFAEDTPVAALERLRPDVYVKGGDYALGAIPETEVMSRWGGQLVTLPYLPGRSTSRLLREVVRRGDS